MMRLIARFFAVIFIASAATILASTPNALAAEDASSYPSRTIHIIVPFAPGGPNDVVARLIADELSARWKASVVVESRPGGGAIIGTQLAARSAPDGYTLLMVSLAAATNLSIKKSLPYDTLKDFTPVIRLVEAPLVLVSNVDAPIHSVSDLISLAKESSGNLNYGTAGTGTAEDLASHLLSLSAGIKMVGVQYNGDPPALLDVLAGRLTWMFATISPSLPHIEAGKLRAIAVSGSYRSYVFPDAPTVAETIPGFNVSTWYGIFATAGTPPAIVTKLNVEIGEILKSEKVSVFLKQQGMTPVGGDADTFGIFFKSEVEKWGKVIKEVGIEPQ